MNNKKGSTIFLLFKRDKSFSKVTSFLVDEVNNEPPCLIMPKMRGNKICL